MPGSKLLYDVILPKVISSITWTTIPLHSETEVVTTLMWIHRSLCVCVKIFPHKPTIFRDLRPRRLKSAPDSWAGAALTESEKDHAADFKSASNQQSFKRTSRFPRSPLGLGPAITTETDNCWRVHLRNAWMATTTLRITIYIQCFEVVRLWLWPKTYEGLVKSFWEFFYPACKICMCIYTYA